MLFRNVPVAWKTCQKLRVGAIVNARPKRVEIYAVPTETKEQCERGPNLLPNTTVIRCSGRYEAPFTKSNMFERLKNYVYGKQKK